jgi:putative ATP-dependent endonuclease of OLD family
MQLVELTIENFRSIRHTSLQMAPFITIIGPNNSGKTNLLLGLQLFFNPRQLDGEDFPGGVIDAPILLDAKFASLGDEERRALSPYLHREGLEVRRSATFDDDGRTSWDTYIRIQEPKDPDFKRSRVHENRERLIEIVSSRSLPAYFRGSTGRVSQASFLSGLGRYCQEQASSLEWDEPTWVASEEVWRALEPFLPKFHYIPPVRRLEEELGGRTPLGELLEHVVERILGSSPRLRGARSQLSRTRRLLTRSTGRDDRLVEIKELEKSLTGMLAEGFPESSVEVEFEPPEIGDFFTKGSRLYVDDGIRTEATSKGHGLQRELMLAILRVYVEYLETEAGIKPTRVFALEEPELYLHPQAQRRLAVMLQQISKNDQVIACTHSPLFVDVSEYQRIRLVSKPSVREGTSIRQVTVELFPGDAKANFRLAVAYNSDRNELFFARKVLLVEGESDKIAFTEMATKLDIDLYHEGISIVEVGGKGNLLNFMKVVGAFGIPYVVVFDTDPSDQNSPSQNAAIRSGLSAEFGLIFAVDPNLDTVLGVTKSQADALGKPLAIHNRLLNVATENVPPICVQVLRSLLPPVQAATGPSEPS